MRGHGAGIALYSLGVLLFAVNDALGKWLVGSYGVAELMALRSLGAAAVLAPLVSWRRPALDIRDQWRLHLLRIACSVVDGFSFYFATRTLPLADVMCFYLAAPLIITALSAALLGEAVGRFRWSAVAIGFLGVAVALHPSGASFSAPALVAVLGATAFAGSITATRRLRRTDWLTLTAWQYLGTGLVGFALAPMGWATPGAVDLGLMAIVGATSVACFVCITKALALAPASLLAPFQYTSIVWAALMGYAVWGDVPGPNVVAGSLVIIASGLAVLAREGVLARERMRGTAVSDGVAPVP